MSMIRMITTPPILRLLHYNFSLSALMWRLNAAEAKHWMSFKFCVC